MSLKSLEKSLPEREAFLFSFIKLKDKKARFKENNA
jgi:hypothetical protein